MRGSKAVLAVALTVLASTPAARADDGRTGANDLTLEFVVDGSASASSISRGTAAVDVGRVTATWDRSGSGHKASAGSTVVERRIGVRVASRPGRRGFVRLSAALAPGDARGLMRLDGGLLTMAPRVVDAQMPIGAVVTHVIQFELPPSAPPGAFASSILWEVEEP
jgi:hypothetical protein